MNAKPLQILIIDENAVRAAILEEGLTSSGGWAKTKPQVHPRDAQSLGLGAGELAELEGRAGGRMIARVVVTDAVRKGELFAPMHWNAQFAKHGRVGPLIEPFTDPIFGQPELKHAAVALRVYRPVWYGFALSRDPLEPCIEDYCTCARGPGYWRYEFATRDTPASWACWAREALGGAGQWLEFADPAAGRYRGASIDERGLRACVFLAERHVLPGREWLGSMFGSDTLDEPTRLSVLAGRPRCGASEAGPIVCTCFSVGRNTLIDAIKRAGLVSVEQIGHALQAGTNCGSCLPELKGLLKSA